ncbi:MAG: plasmid mobilization relaxosome protein MobC, partial [Eubacteriales bacterium]|nr:plasmid mobilization relaxosome protein MobC [Eubacteriales bacterium]
MREKSEMLHFRVSPQELARIKQKKDEIGIQNMGAFLRKMAMDGYCFNMDTKSVLEISSLIRRCSNNLNQYAKRANETGSIYA